jgi:hypothetical protein
MKWVTEQKQFRYDLGFPALPDPHYDHDYRNLGFQMQIWGEDEDIQGIVPFELVREEVKLAQATDETLVLYTDSGEHLQMCFSSANFSWGVAVERNYIIQLTGYLENITAKYILTRPIVQGVSTETFQLARSWLEECFREHADRLKSNNGFMPTRVIKIFEREGKLQAQLFIPDQSKSQAGCMLLLRAYHPYVCGLQGL